MDSRQSREQALRTCAQEQFDVAVVGGGITGCGIARDAALRGLKVALVEKRDFGYGTSSRSTKLVHGGLRYLEQGALHLVWESVNERIRLMRLARHLVRPMRFLFPHYRGDERSLFALDVGLWVYDGLGLFRSDKLHRLAFREGTLRQEPALAADGLTGSISYTDCATDDARLCLENALDAEAVGTTLLNGVEVEEFLPDGVSAIDSETGSRFHLRARMVVIAAGPWGDSIRAKLGEPPLLRTSKGIHLVVRSERLPARIALFMRSPVDRRLVFCIPWGLGRTMVGTTDTFDETPPDALRATGADVDYLLATANASYPNAALRREDVLSTWAGLRPLLRPQESNSSASDASREHVIIEQPRLITVAGGKLTTYRIMAAEVVDRLVGQLARGGVSSTAKRPLPGAVGLPDEASLESLTRRLTAASGDAEWARYLTFTYGARAPELLNGSQERLDEELPYRMCQVDFAVEHEHARTIEDVLARRLQFLLRGADQGLGIAEKVGARLALLHNWSPTRLGEELASYSRVVAMTRAFREDPRDEP